MTPKGRKKKKTQKGLGGWMGIWSPGDDVYICGRQSIFYDNLSLSAEHANLDSVCQWEYGDITPPPDPQECIFVLCCCTFSALDDKHCRNDPILCHLRCRIMVPAPTQVLHHPPLMCIWMEQAATYDTNLIIQTFEMVVVCHYAAFKDTRVSQEEGQAQSPLFVPDQTPTASSAEVWQLDVTFIHLVKESCWSSVRCVHWE